MIKPTVGRVVNFIPADGSKVAFTFPQPLVALVAHVWGDRMVNLACFDASGRPFNETSVTLLQDDDAKPEGGRFAYWMEYQKGQAAKYDALAETIRPPAPDRSEAAIEAEIQAKGLNAPRLSPEGITGQIAAEYVGRASDLFKGCPALPALECLTVAVVALKNGFTVVGTSACASPENFDADLGAKIALANARQQIWPLEGYLLRSRLAEASAKL